MGFSTALYAGISGLDRQQTALDVIGNNISNANTYGYKSERVLFNDMLYNTIKSGTAPAGSSAGTNPSQVGSGVDISVIDTNFNDGEIETTGITTDMAIEGNGFFVLSDGVKQVFTRDGAFSLSQDRVLVSGSTGMAVQGWVASRDNAGNSTINTGGAITDVVIPVGDNRVAKSTSEFVMNGNLNNAGDIASTGTILNSQRLFSAKADVEVTSGAIDLRQVYVKDPAGGVDNVRLFKGTGVDSAAGNEPNVLQSGDQIIVQIMKGSRPLEAIFVYGNNDLVDNTTGRLNPDGTPDFGLESYDGTTLDDFLNWFDQAFGLHAVENQGASPDNNGAHGLDGDNPNDLVDMGIDSTTPFTDETDANGFQFVLANKGSAAGAATPKVAYLGGERTFDIVAGSGADVGIGSSYIDIDEDGSYNKDKDIAMDGIESFVVTGNSAVTKGYQPNSPQDLIVRAFFDTSGGGIGTVIADMAYIDTDGSGVFNADADMLITDTTGAGLISTDVIGAATTVTAGTEATTNKIQLTIATADVPANIADLSVGHFVEDGTTRYFIEKIEQQTDLSYIITLDKTTAWAGGASATFQGAMLATNMGYSASTSTAAGSTIATTLNLPVGKTVNGKYQGTTIADMMTDNEAGKAGSSFIQGDAVVRAIAGTTYAYMDVNGDGVQNELHYSMANDTDGKLFVDIGGVAGTFDTGTDGKIESTATTLAAFADNAIVYTDESTGNVYRKVPVVFDSTETMVYLDKANKGEYDEVRLELENVGHGIDGVNGTNIWVVKGTDTVVSTNAVLGATTAVNTNTGNTVDATVTDGTATIDRPNATIINRLSSGSGRIQIRGNIGIVNEISDISFISGSDKVERNVFAASSLADASGAGYSIVAAATGESVSQNIVVYDSLGKSHDVNLTFVMESKDNDKATWRWYAETADASRTGGIFPVGDPRGATPSVNVGSGTVSFDNFGRFLNASGATPNSEALIAIPLEGQDTDSTLNIRPDFTILTSFANSAGSQVDVRTQDGFAQGVMDRFTVNADGTVTGIYTNGMTETVAQIALAAFANPDGLVRAGGNLFMLGSNSGNAMIGAALTGERGAIRGEALEQSNVDITEEFTKMIVTQRAYQANSRVITKADELLQELMQIIR